MNCIVCGASHFVEKFDSLLIQCTSCGFVTANIDLENNDFSKLYGESYFSGEEYSNYSEDRLILQHNFQKRIDDLKLNMGSLPPDNVLEIGCAYGFFGDSFQKAFPEAHYQGIDIAEEALNLGSQLTGIQLRYADYLDFDHPDSLYSDVFLWDVIEHLPRPDLFIAKMAREVKQGGRVHVTTGDIGKILPRWQGKKWRMIHPPTHLHYFSKKSLFRLFQNHGFEIQYYSYPPIYRSIKQIFFSLFMLNKREKQWKRKIYNKIGDHRFLKLNTYDIIYVIARKIST